MALLLHRAFGGFVVAGLLLVARSVDAQSLVPEEPTSQIVFRADDPRATLERQAPAMVDGHWVVRWQLVCMTSCNAEVGTTGLFRVGGDGIRDSSTFRLRPEQGTISITAKTGSSSGLGWGLASVMAGGVVGGSGAYGIGHNPCADAECERGARVTAAASLVLGSLAVGVGLYLIFAKGTSVSVSETPQATAKASGWLGPVRFERGGIVF
jgi:hypothetical protein